MLQTANGKAHGGGGREIAVEMVKEKLIDEKTRCCASIRRLWSNCCIRRSIPERSGSAGQGIAGISWSGRGQDRFHGAGG